MKTSGTLGLLAEYKDVAHIFHACEKIRDLGFKKFDSFTPFPVHGLDKAMGLKSSRLPWFVLCAGITGAVLAMSFMIWTSAFDYPLNIGGKPTFSIPAFIPITFEVTVLFSALTAVFGMLALNNLPTYYHPLFNVERFAKVTDDKFFVFISASDHKYKEEEVRKLLESTGATQIQSVQE